MAGCSRISIRLAPSLTRDASNEFGQAKNECQETTGSVFTVAFAIGVCAIRAVRPRTLAMSRLRLPPAQATAASHCR